MNREGIGAIILTAPLLRKSGIDCPPMHKCFEELRVAVRSMVPSRSCQQALELTCLGTGYKTVSQNPSLSFLKPEENKIPTATAQLRTNLYPQALGNVGHILHQPENQLAKWVSFDASASISWLPN